MDIATFAPIFITGLAVALALGPLGCFVVWRRMAYFGDALAHSALLGVGFGLIASMSQQIGIVLVALLFVLSFIWLQRLRIFATDTMLGILAHASLALGIIIISLYGVDATHVHDYLFGTFTNVTLAQMGGMVLASGFVLGVLAALWNGLLLMTSSKDLASAEGVPVLFYEFLLMAIMAVMVAAAVQIVGVLPITALLIIPAATAQIHARSPEMMAVSSALLTILAMCSGLALAQASGLASGPLIVMSATVLFLLAFFAKRLV